MNNSQQDNWLTYKNGIIFVTLMWLLSRLLIIISMQLIAPVLDLSPIRDNFIPTPSWELFSHWDGEWYRKIVTEGYKYIPEGKQDSIVFFPLYPLITRLVMLLGLPFEIVGTLVNNLAFGGALYYLYLWAKEQYSIQVAQWATAIMAWCPYSLFGTVTYTEGLFLLCTISALRAFDNRKYLRVTIWGILATASRVPGIMLVPAFLLVSWREKRPIVAYLSSLFTAGGLILFSLYCGFQFNNFLAFKDAQQGWAKDSINWLEVGQKILEEGLFAIDSILKLTLFLGSFYLLWYWRKTMSRITVSYGFCSLALLLAVNIQSANRFIYAIPSLSLALGMTFARYPRIGYAVMGLFSVMLIGVSIRWSWWNWVA